MSGRKGSKMMTVRDFDIIKVLNRQGLSNGKIRVATGRSYNTIQTVLKAADFDEYKRLTKIIADRWRAGSGRKITPSPNPKAPISEQQYTQAKVLLASGFSRDKVREITGRGVGTIIHVDESNTYPEYLEHIRIRNRQRLEAKPNTAPIAPEQSATMPSYEPMVKALEANTKSLSDLALAWNHLADKLDEVLDTKKPWLDKFRQR